MGPDRVAILSAQPLRDIRGQNPLARLLRRAIKHRDRVASLPDRWNEYQIACDLVRAVRSAWLRAPAGKRRLTF